MEGPDLRVRLGPLELKNPVLAASGTFGYGQEYSPLVHPRLLGGVVVKGISLEPRPGNPPPRIVETPSGMLNAIGLANVGLEVFLKEKLPWLRANDVLTIVNIYGHTLEEYGDLARELRGIEGIAALEVNISCPNVQKGGMAFGTDPLISARVTETVVRHADLPVIVKLSPNVTDIREIARAVEGAGAGVISLINTLTGMAVDIERRAPRLAGTFGGLSGPAIRPVALYLVHRVVQAVSLPVIGIGGITCARDALEFLIVGARAVQVGTATFAAPMATLKIVDGLRDYCIRHGAQTITEIIGSMGSPGPPSKLGA